LPGKKRLIIIIIVINYTLKAHIKVTNGTSAPQGCSDHKTWRHSRYLYR